MLLSCIASYISCGACGDDDGGVRGENCLRSFFSYDREAMANHDRQEASLDLSLQATTPSDIVEEFNGILFGFIGDERLVDKPKALVKFVNMGQKEDVSTYFGIGFLSPLADNSSLIS